MTITEKMILNIGLPFFNNLNISYDKKIIYSARLGFIVSFVVSYFLFYLFVETDFVFEKKVYDDQYIQRTRELLMLGIYLLFFYILLLLFLYPYGSIISKSLKKSKLQESECYIEEKVEFQFEMLSILKGNTCKKAFLKHMVKSYKIDEMLLMKYYEKSNVKKIKKGLLHLTFRSQIEHDEIDWSMSQEGLNLVFKMNSRIKKLKIIEKEFLIHKYSFIEMKQCLLDIERYNKIQEYKNKMINLRLDNKQTNKTIKQSDLEINKKEIINT